MGWLCVYACLGRQQEAMTSCRGGGGFMAKRGIKLPNRDFKRNDEANSRNMLITFTQTLGSCVYNC